MAVQIKISLDSNFEKIRAAFAKFPDQVGPFLRTASMKSALAIEGQAKTLSPVDTGRLRASISTSLGVLNKGITSIVQTNVKYAVFVHEGTARMKGRPFMEQAAEAKKGYIESTYQQEITSALKLLEA